MKALSVRAPWWWAILHLGKDIENRDWYTSFRGTIWLHAGKWFSEEGVQDEWFWSVMPMWLQANPTVSPAAKPSLELEAIRRGCGCIVGKIDIVDCRMNSSSPWFRGKWGFTLANPVALATPIPFKGALGFFEVPDDIDQCELPNGVRLHGAYVGEPVASIGAGGCYEPPREPKPLDNLTLWGEEPPREVDLGAAGFRREG
jgi:hypothetical protein